MTNINQIKAQIYVDNISFEVVMHPRKDKTLSYEFSNEGYGLDIKGKGIGTDIDRSVEKSIKEIKKQLKEKSLELEENNRAVSLLGEAVQKGVYKSVSKEAEEAQMPTEDEFEEYAQQHENNKQI